MNQDHRAVYDIPSGVGGALVAPPGMFPPLGATSLAATSPESAPSSPSFPSASLFPSPPAASLLSPVAPALPAPPVASVTAGAVASSFAGTAPMPQAAVAPSPALAPPTTVLPTIAPSHPFEELSFTTTPTALDPAPSQFVEPAAEAAAALDLSDSFAATMRVRRTADPVAPVRQPTVFTHPDHDHDLLAALDKVVELGGSDLHVTLGVAPMIRLHGALIALPGSDAWDYEKLNTALSSIISAPQLEIFERELELDFAYTLTEDSRFRVNIYQQRGSMGAAFRLIPTEIKQLDELGVPEIIGRFSTLSRGLVLVNGPTGSGKSTTLAALIDKVNRERSDHIVTVEDPSEFMHQNKRSLVNQREVGGDTHSFANALKHVLRQDPDVILIGELRDLETISVALTAAETGHLVFATLHTQSAAQTIDRVIDVFPPHQQGQVRSQLAATLQGVVCQTLVRSASGEGRVVATEVMVTTPALANLIREGKTYQVPSAMQAGRDLGMHTMDQHLADLVRVGMITKVDALERAQNKEDLQQLIRGGASASQFRADSDPRAF